MRNDKAVSDNQEMIYRVTWEWKKERSARGPYAKLSTARGVATQMRRTDATVRVEEAALHPWREVSPDYIPQP